MKKYCFPAVLFVFVSAFSLKANAQQDPDVKYNKAKKEYREAQAAKAAQQTIRKQSVETTPVQQQEASSQVKKVEAARAKAAKHSELKAAGSEKVILKEPAKVN